MNQDKEKSTQDAELDLKLNLSPPGPTSTPHSPSSSSTERSLSSSCVSRESSPAADEDTNSGGAAVEVTSMMLVGCPRCLMYVMLSGTNPKCPKCKSTVLLDFFHEERAGPHFK